MELELDTIAAGTVVVGIDGSEPAEQALEWAIGEAVAQGRSLTLLTAVVPHLATAPEVAGYSRLAMEGATSRGWDLLDRAKLTAEARSPELEIHEVLRVTDPRDALIDASRTAHLVVIGSRGRGPVRSLLLGSVGVAVTRHTECPLVVVRPSNPGKVRNGVLVGIDGSERSRSVLEFAFTEASHRGLPLTVLHATLVGHGDTEDAERRRLVSEAMAGMREKFPDVPVRTELAHGHPGERLAQETVRTDLLVVGSHHGDIASELVFGSAATYVVEHAACPVAVVPSASGRAPRG